MILDKLKTITSIKYVDMYYSQDESKMNLIKFPAVLVNLVNINYNKVATTAYDRTLTIGMLFFYSSVKSCSEKETEALTILDDIYQALRNELEITFKDASCIERTSTLTTYYIELEYSGDLV
jgi:hypothetical protein